MTSGHLKNKTEIKNQRHKSQIEKFLHNRNLSQTAQLGNMFKCVITAGVVIEIFKWVKTIYIS